MERRRLTAGASVDVQFPAVHVLNARDGAADAKVVLGLRNVSIVGLAAALQNVLVHQAVQGTLVRRRQRASGLVEEGSKPEQQ